MKTARRSAIILTALTAVLASARPAWAFEEILSTGNPAAGLTAVPGSTFALTDAAISVVRLLAVIFAFFMAAMAVHGYFLVQQNDASLDGRKKAMGVLTDGMKGFAVAIAIAAAAKPLAEAVVGMVG